MTGHHDEIGLIGEKGGSDPAAFGQADPVSLGYNEMIQHPDVDEAECIGQAPGNGAICLGRLSASGRMIV